MEAALDELVASEAAGAVAAGGLIRFPADAFGGRFLRGDAAGRLGLGLREADTWRRWRDT